MSPGRSEAVTSKANGSEPPAWSPHVRPLTHTLECQSTASKRSMTRFPFQPSGTGENATLIAPRFTGSNRTAASGLAVMVSFTNSNP